MLSRETLTYNQRMMRRLSLTELHAPKKIVM
jgi:hypothetical protein